MSNSDFKLARAAVKRQINIESGLGYRLRACSSVKRSFPDLNFGHGQVLVTVLGVGSAACRRVPVSVSCVTKRQPTKRVGRFVRQRWRNLGSFQNGEQKWRKT